MVLNLRRINLARIRMTRQQKRYFRDGRVLLAGRDVTRRCFYLDTRRKRIGLYVHDASGRPMVNETGDGLLMEWHQGRRVRVERLPRKRVTHV